MEIEAKNRQLVALSNSYADVLLPTMLSFWDPQGKPWTDDYTRPVVDSPEQRTVRGESPLERVSASIRFLSKYHKAMPAFDFSVFFGDIESAVCSCSLRHMEGILFAVLQMLQAPDIRSELVNCIDQTRAQALSASLISLLHKNMFTLTEHNKLPDFILPVVLILNDLCANASGPKTSSLPSASVTESGSTEEMKTEVGELIESKEEESPSGPVDQAPIFDQMVIFF
jgi:hypothetical protein